MSEAAYHSKYSRPWMVAGVIGVTYFYFLLFAEFAFISIARSQFEAINGLRVLMGTLGLAGVIGSYLAAAARNKIPWAARLGGGLAACACTGLLSLVVSQRTAFLVDAAGIGLSLGWTTVTLATGLSGAIEFHLGRWIGIGTGAAYGACNLPGIFRASPRFQTELACALAAIAAVGSLRLGSVHPRPPRPPVDEESSPRSRVAWIVILLALVWLDSAAFFIIQNTPDLKSETWGGPGRLLTNALVHLVAAVLAGVALDRRQRAALPIISWIFLATACIMLNEKMNGGPAQIFYTAGVSIYSVVLVYYPARGGQPWLVATVYACAGWLGSAFGIGMAQALQTVPTGFVTLSGAAIACALAVKAWRAKPLVIATMGVSIALLVPILAAQPDNLLVARGRDVYIGEGCIHCHSQYVRPGTTDVEWWGPARPLDNAVAESPPLFGNRRQGPDLTNVGNRRSEQWERIHLIEPTALYAGSRMPSYADLFRPGNSSGDALLAYLASLGTESLQARFDYIRSWHPVVTPPPAGGETGAGLFTQNCAQCHGAAGRGDGPLGARFLPHPPDLAHATWRYVAAFGPDENLALARVIKFGIAGTSMPGHEWLSDHEAFALADLIRSWRKAAAETLPER